MSQRDPLGRLHISRDLRTGNNHVALLLGNRIRLHSLQDTAAHRPYRGSPLRGIGNTAVVSAVGKSGFRRRLYRAVKLLLAGGVVHNDQNSFSLFHRELPVKVLFHNIDQLPFQEFNSRGHKRQFQHFRHHVGAGFQTVKRHYQSRAAGRSRKKLQRDLGDNAQSTLGTDHQIFHRISGRILHYI